MQLTRDDYTAPEEVEINIWRHRFMTARLCEVLDTLMILFKITMVFFSVMNDVSFTNAAFIIAQNPKVTAINSCIECDLTGQVVSDSIGTRIYSGNILFLLLASLVKAIFKIN